MSLFVEGTDRRQPVLLPNCIEDYEAEDHSARVIDVFDDELGLDSLDFEGVRLAGHRPAYHPAMLLKRYICGYLN